MTQDNAEFCLRLERGPCPTSSHDPNGDDIALIHNGIQKATAREGFTVFEYCLPYHEVDYENDVFRLVNGGSDGVRIKPHFIQMWWGLLLSNFQVCIESIFIDGEQIFVGINNDSGNFVIDGNQHTCSGFQMVSPWLEIQNGQVTDSECTGITTTDSMETTVDTQSKNF